MIALAPLLLLVALSAWAVSSPVGSSPDDEFHLASIWCSLGDRPGLCESVTGEPTERVIATELNRSPECFKFESAQSAACQQGLLAEFPATMETDRGNFAGSYPPVYYAVMGVFASENIAVSTIVIRLVSAVLFVGLSTAVFLLLPVRRRPTLLLAWAIGLTPLAMSLIPSTNPSSWAIISAGTLWISLLGFFETTGARRIGLGAIAVIAAVMGAGARADAAVYAGIAIVLVSILVFKRERRVLFSLALPLALAVTVFALFLSARQSGVGTEGFGDHTLPHGMSVLTLFGQNLLDVPTLWAGVFGFWGLGWLDTVMPAFVWVSAGLSFGAVVFTGMRSTNVRKTVAVALALAALWLVPTWILVQSKVLVGAEVQPRYIMPLLILLGGIAVLQVAPRRFEFTTLQLIVLGTALSLVNAVALHINLRRYVSGLDVFGLNLNHNVEWWWPTSITPMVVWMVGTVAFAGAVYVVLRSVARSQALSAPVLGAVGD